MKTEVIQIVRHGGPEVLEVASRELAPPLAGEVLVGHRSIGVNYIDIQHRSGRYPIKDFPCVPGVEGAGYIEAVGPDVKDLKVGDAVAYVYLPIGAYARHRVLPADRMIPIPADMDLAMIGVTINRALTAQYLVKDSYPICAGETVLVHAATGGVGQIVVQWAKHLGAKVIGTVGSEDKKAAALALGCDTVLLNESPHLADEVRQATADGLGVHAVYDGIGAATFERSLLSLRPCGKLVSFGTPSGAIPPFDLFRLNQLGSLSVTSPSIFTFIKSRDALLQRAAEVIDLIRSGVIQTPPPTLYAFSEARQAQIDLQGRKTKGSVGLIVG